MAVLTEALGVQGRANGNPWYVSVPVRIKLSPLRDGACLVQSLALASASVGLGTEYLLYFYSFFFSLYLHSFQVLD